MADYLKQFVNRANVCAIRRKSDGYWWQNNEEHGAGWDPKRIRQAWTHRLATQELAIIARHEDIGGVEIVPLVPAATTKERDSLIAEVERLRNCLRWTHETYCTSAYTNRGLHAPECMLYEVEDNNG